MLRALSAVLLALSPIPAHAAVEQTPDGGLLSNELLNVSLSTGTGVLTVTDKASGATFRQPDSLRDPLDGDDILVVPPAEGLELDGQVGDWVGTPVRAIASTMLTSEQPWECDGDVDLSAVVGFRWDDEFIYAMFLVRDDQFVPGDRSLREWWERDSVEWRVGWDQTGVMLDAADPGGFLWSDWQEWSTAAVREVADYGDEPDALAIAGSAGLDWSGAKGYIVETATAVDRFITVKPGPVPGRRFRISAGVNDADATGEREAQVYFPETFAMGQSMTYTVGILADADGNTPDIPDGREPACTEVEAIGENGLSFVVTADRPEATIGHVRCEIELSQGERDLGIACSVVDGWEHEIPLFRGFLPDPGSAEYVASIYGNGVLIPSSDLAPPSTWLRPFDQLDMPAVGVVSEAGDALCIFTDHDNTSCTLSPAGWSGEQRLGLILQGDNVKGERLPEYHFTWHFAGSGGYVGLAKRLREHCVALGWVKTLREKIEGNPNIERLFGAPDVWGDSSLEFARKAKAAGIDRMLINGSMTPETIAAMNDLGYLTGEYDQYVDVDENTEHIGDIDPLEDHIRIQANGERATGWINLDRSHTWYSRCSETALMGAQHEIPDRLATHPFTARFLDVHTAMGLVECYSPDHPCTRTEDRANKTEMLQWIREQGVVVGGEHGRAWSAPVLDYQEGMMSHNPYFTWPAGHLVKIDSEEQIGERYLKWGINPERRVPFWELVFHDCVVSTWYWGDSVGYHEDVRPDLTDRKVAMTALYGAAPLFWASRLGLGFSTDEEKARFLQAYRNCCKIHEAVAEQRMVSHEYLSEDRLVQRSTFSDGTTVTVNFGEEPARVQSGGKRWTLPMNGIVADGPTIHQHIALIDDTVETYIERPGYRFLEREEGKASRGGLECIGPLTVQLIEPGRMRLFSQPTTTYGYFQPEVVDAMWQEDGHLLVHLGDMVPSRYGGHGVENGAIKAHYPGWTACELVYGPCRPRTDVGFNMTAHPFPARQGGPLGANASLYNYGRDDAETTVRLYWDREDRDRLIAELDVSVPSREVAPVLVPIETEHVDGLRQIILVADAVGDELVSADNRATIPVEIRPSFATWPIRVPAAIDRPEPGVVISTDVDLTAHLDGQALDPASVRVAFAGADGQPSRMLACQFEPSADYDPSARATGTLLVEWPGDAPNDGRVVILGAPPAAGLLSPPGPGAVPTPGRIWRRAYSANVTDGAARPVEARVDGRPTDLIRQVIFSSQATGWSEPEGTLDEFEVLSDGPVRTVIRTVKTLRGGNVVTRTYDFRGDHFFVDASADEVQQGLFSRLWYDREGTYEDSGGNKTHVDGDGADEIAAVADPKWFCMYSDEASHACIALSPMAGIVYWDEGEAYGQVGFQSASATGFRVAHIITGPQENADFAREWYERLTNPPRLVVGE